MGTWGEGIFQGDGPLDCVGEQTDWLTEQLGALAEAESTPEVAARLGAVVGLCLQLNAYAFESDGETFAAALATHREELNETLPAEGLALIERVSAGEAEGVADELREGRRQSGSADVEALAGGFGIPAPGLLELPAARAVAQQLAERCAAAVDEGFAEEGLDLYEVDFMGAFGLLLLIEPCAVDAERVSRWRQSVQEIYAQMRQENGDDGDMPFFSDYMENVETAFEVALEKFG